MNDEDAELERLKAKRFAEMQKNISVKQRTKAVSKSKPENKAMTDSRSILVKVLGFRGLEVLEHAESQFPHQTPIIIKKLSDLIKTGEVNEVIDGGKLLALFRAIGLNIRMETRISVEQDGKFVSLSDKLSSQSSTAVDDKDDDDDAP